MAPQAGAYPGFSSMKRLGVFLLPLDGMLVLHRVTPCIKFAATHLYTWVERDTLRVSCPRSRHNVPCQDWNPERVSSTLTMAPPCFSTICCHVWYFAKYVHAHIFEHLFLFSSVFVLNRSCFLSFSCVSRDAMFSWDTWRTKKKHLKVWMTRAGYTPETSGKSTRLVVLCRN